MHGLINRAFQCFINDTYGRTVWEEMLLDAELPEGGFEAMLIYEDDLTVQLLRAAATGLNKPVSMVLEDVGTYLVSHPNCGPMRRLLRFGGTTFLEFLHSLDDLPDWARLAVPDLDLPDLELREITAERFNLFVRFRVDGTGHIVLGVLRAMADDYGALVLLDMHADGPGSERIAVQLLETSFAEGRTFDLASVG